MCDIRPAHECGGGGGDVREPFQDQEQPADQPDLQRRDEGAVPLDTRARRAHCQQPGRPDQAVQEAGECLHEEPCNKCSTCER